MRGFDNLRDEELNQIFQERWNKKHSPDQKGKKYILPQLTM